VKSPESMGIRCQVGTEYDLLNAVNDACSSTVAANAGTWLQSPHKTLWRLCCMYLNVRQEIFRNSSAGKCSCHLIIKQIMKYQVYVHFPENMNCECCCLIVG
jgi:hypothetical protein